MKHKNIILKPIVGIITSAFLVSCDGGGGAGAPGSTVDEDFVITLPPNPNEVVDIVGDGSGESTDDSQEALLEDEIFLKINQTRVSNGQPALTRDSNLDTLANGHSNYLIEIANPGGALVVNHDNAQARGNSVFGFGFTAYAENVGALRGFSNAVVSSEFVNGWVNSPGHLANILGNYTNTGIALSVDSRDGTIYATQIFSR